MAYVIPYVVYAVEAIGTAVSVYSAVDQAKTAKETAKYNEQADNAEAANREALAAEAIRRQREQNRRKIADLRNNLANNGTLSTEGTPLAIIGESSANLELGVQDAARTAANQANSLRARGQMGLWEADQTATADYEKGTSSALSGIGSGVKGYVSDVKNGVVDDSFGIFKNQ